MESGLRVIPLTGNDQATMSCLNALSVDGLRPSYPDLLRRVMMDKRLYSPRTQALPKIPLIELIADRQSRAHFWNNEARRAFDRTFEPSATLLRQRLLHSPEKTPF